MMTRMTRLQAVLTTAGLTLSLGLSACEQDASPLDPTALTHKSALYVEGLSHEAGLALSFTVADDGTVMKAMGSTSATAAAIGSPGMTGVMPAPSTAMLRATVGPRMTRQMMGLQLPSMMTPEEEFDETGHELRRIMQERLFVATNLESKTGEKATYWLHPDPTCRPLPLDDDPPGTVPAIDPACADDLTKVEGRIAVQADGDGMRMTILIGPDRLELATVIVHSDELAGEIDLPKAKVANDYIQAHTGDGSAVGTFDRLAGKLRGSLKKVAPRKVTIALSIVEAIDIAPTNDIELTSAAANPVIALTSDGTNKSAALTLGLGATQVATTWDPQGTSVTNRDLRVVLGGVYGKVTLNDGQSEILLTDVGVAQSRVTVRGTPIVDLNLNADTMRRFSGKVTVNADGISRLELTPKFDLSVAFDYNAVAADLSSPPDAVVAHETYGATFINGAAPAVLEEVASSTAFGGGVRIVAGTLTLSASSVPAETVIVPTGKCLTSRTAPSGSHPLLGGLITTDCP